MIVISSLLAVAASTSAISANRQSIHDRDVKRAIEAADAGVEVGTYRLNKLAGVVDTVLQCVTVNAATGALTVEAVLGDGWCRAQSEDLGEGAQFSYRVSAVVRLSVDNQDVFQRKLVSTGSVGGVQRRVSATINAPTGQALFADAVLSDEDLSMRNSSQIIGGARSNGNIVTENSSQICGDATVGPGKEFRGDGLCAGYTSQQATEPFVLGPVVVPLTNDNARIGTLDSWTNPDSISWDPLERTLSLRNDATLTLTGGSYVFCSLTLDNSARLITPDDGSPVRIYIDAPENCGGQTLSFATYNSSTVQNDSADPTMVQLYVAGSPSISTLVELRNRTELHMVVYAPHSVVTFDNFSRLVGAIAAKRVVVQNNLEILWDERVGNLLVGDVPLPVYTRQSWLECAAVPPGPEPDAGC